MSDSRKRSFKFNVDSDDYTRMMEMLDDLGGESRKFIGKEVKGWNQDPETILNAMTKMAFHETGPQTGLSPDAVSMIQKTNEGSGPGRGLFQYEKTFRDKEGNYAQAGGMTARNRLAQYIEGKGQEVPSWLSQEGMEDPSIGFDASQLSPSQQYMLFLGDKAMDETAHMRDIHKEGGVKDFWAKEHWAGPKEQLQSKLKSFGDSMGVYQDSLLDQIMSK